MTIPKITHQYYWAASAQLTGNVKPRDICNKAIEIALAEQQAQPETIIKHFGTIHEENGKLMFTDFSVDGCGTTDDSQTATAKAVIKRIEASLKQAQPEPAVVALKEINARIDKKLEAFHKDEPFSPELEELAEKAIAKLESVPVEQWQENDNSRGFDKLAEKQSPEILIPVDPHAALRAEYIRQRDAVPCELGFYLWEFNYENRGWECVGLNTPIFDNQHEYRCTDISCYVSKDGEPAIRMLRTEAQELQREWGGTVEWWAGTTKAINGEAFTFNLHDATYTYHTKATIKLDGKMVTPEQAAAEWEAKKETYDLYRKNPIMSVYCPSPNWHAFDDVDKHEYELRPKALKQVSWTGSPEDVIALLKEMGLLKEGAV